MIDTVGDLIKALSVFDPDTPVRVNVDDGCGCCSSGGNLEPVIPFVSDGIVELN